MTATASVDDFRLTFDGPAPGLDRNSAIQAALDAAEAQIVGPQGVGWDFARHPADGEEVRLLDGRGTRTLHVHSGIVAVSLVEIAAGGGTWAALGADDWFLSPAVPEPGEPFTHVVLADEAPVGAFPAGRRNIRLTGAFGYASPPPTLVPAEVALARQLYRSRSTTPGGMAGPDEWSDAATAVPRGWPDETYRFVQGYRSRFVGCHA